MRSIIFVRFTKNKPDCGIGKSMNLLINALRESEEFDIIEVQATEGLNYLQKLFTYFFTTPKIIIQNILKKNIIILETTQVFPYILISRKYLIPVIHSDVTSSDISPQTKKISLSYFLFTAYAYIYSIIDKLFNYSNRIITVSHHLKKIISEKYHIEKNRISTVHNICHLAQITESDFDQPIFLHYKNTANLKKLLYVGNEYTHKNFITLLKLMRELDNNEYQLIKVGNSDYPLNRLMHLNYIEKYNLNVKFFDKVTQGELTYAYKSSHCYLYSSIKEAFGMTPIEAQLAGLPVISTNCEALEETLQNSAMIVQNPTNHVEFKEFLMQLNNTEVRKDIINKGYENAKRFNKETAKNQFIRIINELSEFSNIN